MKSIFDYSDGDFCMDMGGGMMMDSDGNLMQDMDEDKTMYLRLDKLAQSYQHFISTYCDGDKNKVLGPLKEYAQCFRQVFRPEQCNMSIPASFGIERLKIVIFGLKNATLVPYVLYIAKNVAKQDELDEMYGILESYMMRRITVHASTKYYNNLFTSLILNKVLTPDALREKLLSYKEINANVPNDYELEEGFKKSRLVNLQSKGILFLIETKIRPTGASTAILGFNSYSLEHLMPKKWRNRGISK